MYPVDSVRGPDVNQRKGPLNILLLIILRYVGDVDVDNTFSVEYREMMG